jgi:hypothetical protein
MARDFVHAQVGKNRNPQPDPFQRPRTQTALGTTITGSVSNGVREGVGEVFDLYAKRTLKDIEENGHFVRVAAGKEFYVYVLDAVDPKNASLAGIKPRQTLAHDLSPAQAPHIKPE